MLTKREIAKSYLDLLAKADITELLGLFDTNATVDSPIYGTKNAKLFYTELFDDTNNSSLYLKGIFEDSDTGDLALFFSYGWTMSNGKHVNFDVVDILRFTQDLKILSLQIIYDTVQSRAMIEDLRVT